MLVKLFFPHKKRNTAIKGEANSRNIGQADKTDTQNTGKIHEKNHHGMSKLQILVKSMNKEANRDRVEPLEREKI